MDVTDHKAETDERAKGDILVARMLRIGSTIAASLIAVGLMVALAGLAPNLSTTLVTAGLVVLVLTPVLRVVTAFLAFLRERDFIYAFFSFLVLVALAIGVVLGRAH